MEIFCQRCQKRVGQVADEKIPVGQKASVKCPACGEKIILTREASLADPDLAAGSKPPVPSPASIGAAFSGLEEAGQVHDQPVTTGTPPNLTFSIGAILKEAWEKTSGVKGTIWGAAFMVFLAMIGLGIVARMLSTLLGGDEDNLALNAALQLTFTIALYPFLAGVMMIGIRRSVGLPVGWKMAFGYFTYLVPVVIAAFLVTVLSFVGFLLLLVPGIYLSLAYSLAVPLVVDKGMGPWEAMETSRKTIHQCWFKVFGLYLVMALIYLVSMIPLGLGLIWTVPMFVMASAILYRELFGVSEKI